MYKYSVADIFLSVINVKNLFLKKIDKVTKLFEFVKTRTSCITERDQTRWNIRTRKLRRVEFRLRAAEVQPIVWPVPLQQHFINV